MLLRRRKAHGETMKQLRPKKYELMNKRIFYLYKKLNFHTKDVLWKKDYAKN